MLIEVIATSVEEALLAEKYGANRIELIHAFADGGLSPALCLTQEVCAAVSIPVNVMVRPHAVSFSYSPSDMLTILREITFIGENTQANGVVFGSLNAARQIDFTQLEQVIAILTGSGLELTFHRAIDESTDCVSAFHSLQAYGGLVNRVLSSGGAPTAIQGMDRLRKMQQLRHPSGAILLAGSGLNPENVAKLIQAVGVGEIHLGSGLRRNAVLDAGLFTALFRQLE